MINPFISQRYHTSAQNTPNVTVGLVVREHVHNKNETNIPNVTVRPLTKESVLDECEDYYFVNDELLSLFNTYSIYLRDKNNLCSRNTCDTCNMNPVCNDPEEISALLLAEILSELKKQNAEIMHTLKSIDYKLFQMKQNEKRMGIND